jgi:hypothetical protein
MIERYLGGAMSAGEEREFLRRLATDRDLRHGLDAERAIRRTLAEDRNALPREDPSVRSHVMMMLGVMAPALEQTVSTAAGSSATTAASGAASQGVSLLAGGIAKGIAIALAGGALAVGAFITTYSDSRPQSTASVHTASRTIPASISKRVEEEVDVNQVEAKQVEVKPEVIPSISSGARQASAHVRSTGKPAESAPAPITPHLDQIPSALNSPNPHVVVTDSMHLHVTIDLGKLRR